MSDLYQTNCLDAYYYCATITIQNKSLFFFFSLNPVVRLNQPMKRCHYDFVANNTSCVGEGPELSPQQPHQRLSPAALRLDPSKSRLLNPDSSLVSSPSWNNEIPSQWQSCPKTIRRNKGQHVASSLAFSMCMPGPTYPHMFTHCIHTKDILTKLFCNITTNYSGKNYAREAEKQRSKKLCPT